MNRSTLLLSALLVAGCDRAVTQLVVAVDSDLSVPDELARVNVRVRAAAGRELSEHTFPLAAASSGEGSFVGLPFTFGVVPRDDDPSRVAIIEIEAMAPEGSSSLPVMRRRIVTGFMEGRTLILPIFLARSCLATVCAAGETCSELGCVPEEVPPDTLGEPNGGYDGGARGDTGVVPDATSDAAATDAEPAMDSGVEAPDAGAMDADGGMQDGGIAVPPRRFDFNGDGKDDMLFGAPHYGSSGFAEGGRAYVMFGPRTSGDNIAGEADRIYEGVENNAFAGAGVSAIGDLDGDGYSDFAIGAPADGLRPGKVYIYRGGPQLAASGPLTQAPIVLTGEPSVDWFGSSMSHGDFNGDGKNDLLIGAGARGDLTARGAAYIFYGDSHFGSRTADRADVKITGERPGTYFGLDVAGVGDLNGDNVDDFTVGAPAWEDGTELWMGRVYVFFGAPVFASRDASLADTMIDGNAYFALFGAAITGAGDFNADGYADLAVGSGLDEVHLFYGDPAFATNARLGASLTIGGAGAFGREIAGGQDVTGDGWADLIVGAPVGGSLSAGRVYVFQGGPTPSGAPYRTFSGGCAQAGRCTNEELGLTVSTAMDVDGDGDYDITVGSRFEDNGPAPGRIAVFLGGIDIASTGSESAHLLISGEDARSLCAVLDEAPLD